MTCYPRPDTRPPGKYLGFHSIEFFVGNAKATAANMQARMGFVPSAYKGLETGSRDFCSHVISQNNIQFVYTSALNPVDNEVSRFVAKHGDGVRDVKFLVEDCKLIYDRAVSKGAVSVMEPKEVKDEHGTVIMASLQTYGSCIHTLVQNVDYKGPYLPGFVAVTEKDPLDDILPKIGLEFIDHCVGNQDWDQMKPVCEWYSEKLDFHQFWSVDDTQVHTQYSALRSIVMTDYDRVIKMPINEPAEGLKKSQIKEFVDYHGDAGVQHIALRTEDILTAVANLKARGVRFLTIPSSYYDTLGARLDAKNMRVAEDLAIIRKLNILVDFDENGYLLQIFTAPVEDRPTLFYEIIQRRNHEGFGAGNFQALFESIQLEQAERGNLTDETRQKKQNVDASS